MRNNISEIRLMKALMNCPKEAYDLAKNLGAAIDANRVYEQICTRPGQEQVRESKKGIVLKKANAVLGILCKMERHIGETILLEYIKTPEQKVTLVKDLDDFFNYLYVLREDEAGN